MPKIPLYQPRNVDFGGQTPKIPQNVMGPPLTVNARANTRAGEARIRALGAGIKAREAMVKREDTLVRKFQAIAQVGDQIHSMGMRMFDLSQEATYNSNMAQAQNFILREKEKALQNPDFAEAEQEFSRRVSEAEGDHTAGLLGLKKAQATANYHNLSLRAAIDVRAKAREKLISQTLASDYERLVSVKKQIALPETTWDETMDMVRKEKANNAQRVAQNMISAQEAAKADVSLENYARYQQVKKMIDADPRTAALGWDSAANPQLMVFARSLPAEMQDKAHKYAVGVWEDRVTALEKAEKLQEEALKKRKDATFQILARQVVAGRLGKAKLQEYYQEGLLDFDKYQKLEKLYEKESNPDGNSDLYMQFRVRVPRLESREDALALQDEIAEARGGPDGLSDKETEQLYDELDPFLKGEQKENDPVYTRSGKEAEKHIERMMTTTGYGSQYDPAEAARKAHAIDEFRRLVRGGEDIIKARDTVVQRYDPQPQILARLPKPRFYSPNDPLLVIARELTEQALQDGRLSQEEFNRELELILRILELKQAEQSWKNQQANTKR